MTTMDHTVYEERLAARRMMAILGVATAVIIGLTGYLLLTEEFGAVTAGMLVASSAVLLAVTVAFRRLPIRCTDEGVTVGYGPVRTTVSWERVEGGSRDDVSTARYGGWGIRVTRVDGRWRLGYNTIGTQRVVLSVPGGRFDELAFSTGDPEAVLAVVERHTGG